MLFVRIGQMSIYYSMEYIKIKLLFIVLKFIFEESNSLAFE